MDTASETAILGKRYFPWIGLLLAGLVAYHNGFGGPFLWDDYDSVVENPHIRQLWPFWETWQSDSGPTAGRPISAFSFALNYAMGALDPRGYHAVNIGLHLIAGLLAFALVRRTLQSPRLRERVGARSTSLAFAVALVWMVHPLQTEGVNYITQRTELLMGVFFLTTLYCVARSMESASPWKWDALAIASCASGMASKEVMVSAPLMAFLYHRIFWAKTWRDAVHGRWQIHGGLAMTWGLLLFLVLPGHHREVAGFSLENLSSWQYLMTESGVILHYLRLAFWPGPLVLDYADWPVAQSLADVTLPMTLMVGLVAATVWAVWRASPWGFLGAFFFFVLAPTSSVLPLQTEVAAERRMYLPLIALIAGTFVGGYVWLCNRRPHVDSRVGWILTIVVVIVLGWLTVERNQEYQSDIVIWSDTIQKRPQNARAHNNLGFAFAQAENYHKAISSYEMALQLVPDYPLALSNLGTALLKLEKTDEAIPRFQTALQLNPNHPPSHCGLGIALFRQGRIKEAISHYQQALQVRPNYAIARTNLGVALASQGQLDEAMDEYRQVLRLDPMNSQALYNLGNALLKLGKLEEAVLCYQQSLSSNPSDATTLYNYAQTLAQLGRADDAARAYRDAIRVRPDFTDAHNNLANLLFRRGDFSGASKHFAEVVRLRPDTMAAQMNLGLALYQLGEFERAATQFSAVLQRRPDLPDAHYNLATTMRRLGKQSDAIAEYLAALRLRPDWPEALDTLSSAYAESGQWPDAIQAAERALTLARAAGKTELAATTEKKLNTYREQKLPEPTAHQPKP